MKTRVILLGLLLAGCTKTETTPPEAEDTTAQPQAAKETEAPASAAEEAEVTPPPPRDDDAERASENGRLEAEVGGVPVIVQYGRPKVKGREVFGDLVPYGEIWRTGADEATTLTLMKDAKVAGEPVEAGTYALFTVPGEEAWTVVLNEVAKQWGAYKHDPKRDVLRAKVEPQPHDATEVLTFEAKDDAVVLKWADVMVPVPIEATS
jgi:hypothetical protein